MDDKRLGQFSSVQSLSRVWLPATPWVAARQASCPSPSPGVHPNSCPSSQWCHLAISSSVIPSSSCLQSFPPSGYLKWVSSLHQVAKVLELQLQHQSLQWIFRTDLLGWTGWISLQSKGLSRVFSNTTVQKHQFFGAQLSSQSNSHIHTWPLEKP